LRAEWDRETTRFERGRHEQEEAFKKARQGEIGADDRKTLERKRSRDKYEGEQ
jgi:hypothetical protein